ncbi:Sec-independent protein translocase protein TatB [Arenimonas sp.]|uniref:Sec-independent protein translocase protein TatB n=1 Tax=Arenimonas sp. TaxID=1872635 RepID=UPI002E3175C3|nr:Sec-independent protein translocase protein TatB [Arenimonas sp.]HEX4853944.1 Sec-independent protein translocase protein TatB [Arenimonas sp.]
MFDIGFSELLIIAVVALVVLGPERLPKAARYTGLWVRKARAQWYSVKAEFEREMAADELKRSVGNPAQDLRQELDAVGKEVSAAAQAAGEGVRDAEALARADADTAIQDIPPSTGSGSASPTDPSIAAAREPGTEPDPVPAPEAGPDFEFYSDPEPFKLTPDDVPAEADAPKRPGASTP